MIATVPSTEGPHLYYCQGRLLLKLWEFEVTEDLGTQAMIKTEDQVLILLSQFCPRWHSIPPTPSPPPLPHPQVPRVYLKPPMPMDTMQSPCVLSWSEFCYRAKTEAKTSKWCFRAQKRASQSIKFAKTFPGGTCPQTSLALILYAFGYNYRHKSPTMQLCFRRACVFVSMFDVHRCAVMFQGWSAWSADKFFSRFTAKRMLFTRSRPPLKVFQRSCHCRRSLCRTIAVVFTGRMVRLVPWRGAAISWKKMPHIPSEFRHLQIWTGLFAQ